MANINIKRIGRLAVAIALMVSTDGGDVPSHKSLDVSSYNFKSSDNNYTYYFNVY